MRLGSPTKFFHQLSVDIWFTKSKSRNLQLADLSKVVYWSFICEVTGGSHAPCRHAHVKA